MGRSTGSFGGGGSRSSGSRSASTRSAGTRSSGGGSRAGFSSGRSSGHASSSSRSTAGGGFGSTKSVPSRSGNSMPGNGTWRGSGPAVPPPAPRPRWGMWGVPGWGYRRSYGPSYGGGYAPSGGYGCGCLPSLISTIITLVLVAVLFLAFAPTACVSNLVGSGGHPVTIQTSTTARTKLPASDCTPIDQWYDDLAEWVDDPSAVTSGMKRFYDKTGVQPYLIICTNIEGEKDYDISQVEAYMRGRYDELFGNDDGHLILLFCEPYDGEYDPYLLVGLDAQSVIDRDAEDIIYSAVDDYYDDSSLSNSAYFGKVFSTSADAIMAGSTGVTQSTNTTQPAPPTTSPVVMAVAGIACGGVIAWIVLRIIRSRSQA